MSRDLTPLARPRRGSPGLVHGMLLHARYAAAHLPRCALPALRFDPGLELTGVRCADVDGCEEARCTARCERYSLARAPDYRRTHPGQVDRRA